MINRISYDYLIRYFISALLAVTAVHIGEKAERMSWRVNSSLVSSRLKRRSRKYQSSVFVYIKTTDYCALPWFVIPLVTAHFHDTRSHLLLCTSVIRVPTCYSANLWYIIPPLTVHICDSWSHLLLRISVILDPTYYCAFPWFVIPLLTEHFHDTWSHSLLCISVIRVPTCYCAFLWYLIPPFTVHFCDL
jgi:hypothetical protein